MEDPVLVILAAGLGSRYGGLKQIDTIGNNGESIIDFSIYDAYQAGFRKVILIIREEHEELFEENIGSKVRPFMDVVYAYQDVNDLPEGFICPEDRIKPWGTTHALLCTEKHINGPFMIINADDFYGKESYKIMYSFLKNEVKDNLFGMVGYQLTKTLSDSGAVTRAVCKKDEHGNLAYIEEYKKIIRKNGEAYQIKDGKEIKLEDSICSMNYWGFTPAVFPMMKTDFVNFLKEQIGVDKSELVIPTSVAHIIENKQAHVKVMSTTSEWFGVTYPQDKEEVQNKVAQYKEDDIYPFDLWA